MVTGGGNLTGGYANVPVVTTTGTYYSVYGLSVASAAGIQVGYTMTGLGANAGTQVTAINGTGITVSRPLSGSLSTDTVTFHGFKQIQNGYIRVGSLWKTLKEGYAYISGSGWKKFFSSAGGTPDIEDSSTNSITTKFVGLTLYGYAGSGVVGSYSFAWQYSFDGSVWNNETGTGATGTGSGSTTRKTYTTDTSDDKVFIRYAVTYGGVTNYSGSVSITKRKPVLNTTGYSTDPVLTGTAQVGQTLSISSHWVATTTITNDTLPDYYVATWTGTSGTTTYSSRSSDSNYSSTWYNYVIASGDLSGTVSVYITAYNSGGNTQTATRTSGTVVSGLGDFTYQAYDASTVTKPSAPSFTKGSGAYVNYIFLDWVSTKPSDVASYNEYLWGSAAFANTYTASSPLNAGITTINTHDINANYSSTSAYTYEDYWILNSTASSSPFNCYVTATGNNKKAGVSWTTSTNANSYKISYTISGASSGNGTFSFVQTSSPFIFDMTTYGGTFTINSVTSYTTTDGTGSNTHAGTLQSGKSSQTTPAIQTSSATSTTTASYTYTIPPAGDPYFTFTRGSTGSQGSITVYSTDATTISYYIYRTGNGSGATSTGYGTANTYSYWDSGSFSAASGTYYLPRNGYYYMTATATNASGSNANGTQYSNYSSSTVYGQNGTTANWGYAGTPLAPISASVAKNSTNPSTQVDISWTQYTENSGTTYPNNVETYEIWWQGVPNTTSVPTSTSTADYSGISFSSSSYTASQPASSTRYYFVRSRNSTNTQSGQTVISGWTYAGGVTTDAASSGGGGGGGTTTKSCTSTDISNPTNPCSSLRGCITQATGSACTPGSYYCTSYDISNSASPAYYQCYNLTDCVTTGAAGNSCL